MGRLWMAWSTGFFSSQCSPQSRRLKGRQEEAGPEMGLHSPLPLVGGGTSIGLSSDSGWLGGVGDAVLPAGRPSLGDWNRKTFTMNTYHPDSIVKIILSF